MERQIEESKDFLTEENKTLHSENRSLTGILTLHQQEIKQLQEENQRLSGSNYETVNQVDGFQLQVASLEQERLRLQHILGEKSEEMGYYRDKYEG